MCVESLNYWLRQIHYKDLSLLHVNIRSLKKHFSEFLVTLGDDLSQLDIIVITEANINFSVLSFYNIPGFQVNVYTREGRSGGGVLVYSRTELAARASETAAAASAGALAMRSAECVSITLNINGE